MEFLGLPTQVLVEPRFLQPSKNMCVCTCTHMQRTSTCTHEYTETSVWHASHRHKPIHMHSGTHTKTDRQTYRAHDGVLFAHTQDG